MNDFKIGDNVICIKQRNHIKVGTKGIVVDTIDDNTPQFQIGVDWEVKGGHDMGNGTLRVRLPGNTGQFLFPTELKLINESKNYNIW